MHLSNFQLEGKGAKDLEFVKKVSYVLHGLKFADRPSPKTMFEWLWHQIKGLPILHGITDKVRESSQGSQRRSFEWIWTRERRHDMNYENVVKGLRGSPPHQLALPATGGEQSTKTPKRKGPKKAATSSPAQPAAPGPLEATQPVKMKIPCALHASGYCKYGEKCRNNHVWEAGSEAARKSFAEHQKKQRSGR